MFQNQHPTNNGITLKINDAKISCNAKNTTWNTRLSQFHRTDAFLSVCTYSLPNNNNALIRLLSKRPYHIGIICHENFRSTALYLQNQFPRISFSLLPDIHAKFVLLEPHTVWLGSANFGFSNWNEIMLGMHNKKAFDYLNNIWDCLFWSGETL